LEAGALLTLPLKFDTTFFCEKCAGMATGKTCPHDESDRLHISGTKLREMLANKEVVPPEFSRAEVLSVLLEYYNGLD
jgi:sulfate adenylyltransferase